MDARAPAAGFTGTLQQLGASLLGAVYDRVELLGLELQEEKFRLVRLFLWISAVFFTGVMALTFASLTLVYLFWETARLAVLGGLTAFYLGAVATLIVTLRRHLTRQPRPFAATLAELQEDQACIRGAN